MRPEHQQLPLLINFTGDVYSLMLGTQTLVVLSSDQAVKELLDRRSGIYSDRLGMYIGQTLCSDGLRMLMMVCCNSLQDQQSLPSVDIISRATDRSGEWFVVRDAVTLSSIS